MREAKRLFSKTKNKQLESFPSSVFKSKIMRDLPDQSKNSSLGPGQYNVSLPIVKPKFQAIRKNHNTIIIKINQKLSPVFQSIEPRFKEIKNDCNYSYQTIQQDSDKNNLKNNPKTIQTQKISNGMKNRIKKISDILRLQEQKSSKNIKINFQQTSFDGLQNSEGNEQVSNSLKLYKKERQRLHFLLKYMKPTSNPRGFQWSKYRETKGNLYSINNVPGPGSYDQKKCRSTNNRYFQSPQDKSWQFKSVTRRCYFKNSQQKMYELAPKQNRFISDINGKFYKVDSIPILKNKSSKSKIQIDDNQI